MMFRVVMHAYPHPSNLQPLSYQPTDRHGARQLGAKRSTTLISQSTSWDGYNHPQKCPLSVLLRALLDGCFEIIAHSTLNYYTYTVYLFAVSPYQLNHFNSIHTYKLFETMVRLLGSKQKDTMSGLLFPTTGQRDVMLRKGLKPKDHMKDNARQIKDAEKKMRALKLEAEVPPAPLFKMTQFKEVESRVFESAAAAAKEAEDRVFLERRRSEKRIEDLAHQRRVMRAELEAKLAHEQEAEGRPSTPRKAAVPRAAEPAKLAPRHETNFIGKNRVKALTSQPPRHELVEPPRRHESFGRVPDYLEERNAQVALARERALRNAPDPSCPPGMTVMPEDERLDTLAKLSNSQTEVLRALQNMPFVIETPSQKNKQTALENKLKEIENAIKLFNKPKVYIAL